MAYAGVVLFNKNKFLLQLRDNNPNILNPNKWGIFGGGIKKGENPEQAAIRELREELELNVEKLEFAIETNFDNENIYIFKHKIKDISNLRLKEGANMQLFSKKEILNLKNTVPGLKQMIKDIF